MGELTRRENEWQDRATAAAIAAARRVVLGDAAVIPMNTPIGRLSDTEWGWIATAVIFAWISVRAEQAASVEVDVEKMIRAGFNPDPWDFGAIASILPKLADHSADVDWTKPLAEWPRETMVQFLQTALALVRYAIACRDNGGCGITRNPEEIPDFNDPLPREF
jgi:hypothetical protein